MSKPEMPREVIIHKKEYKLMLDFKKYCKRIGEDRINFKEATSYYTYKSFGQDYNLKPLWQISCIKSEIYDNDRYHIYIDYHIGTKNYSISIHDNNIERDNWEREKEYLPKLDEFIVKLQEVQTVEEIYNIVFEKCLVSLC